MNRTVTFMAGMILVWLTGYILIVGRGFFVPIVIAIFIWYLINTLNNAMQSMPFLGKKLPYWISSLLSLLIIILMVALLVNIISANVNDVVDASSRYQDNLMRIMTKIDDYFHIKILTNINEFIKSLSIQKILVDISTVFTAVMSSAILIALYVVFLFVEQHFFIQKMDALFKKPDNKQLANSILTHIVRDTQTYLGLKTLMSLIIAVGSWIIMRIVGLDFAEFWAMLIFFLNYIPNIGPIIATAFPALLALIQFESWFPFIIITSIISALQFIVGNIIEPKYLGQSLNLSALVILLALALWGSIWGVLGMLLAVPITVMMMIIFAHFKATRPVAILLSQDGQINKAYETL
jgi:AI-2 transport protein TqsA